MEHQQKNITLSYFKLQVFELPPWDELEIHAVKDYPNGDFSLLEETSEETPTMWSVYIHLVAGGLECIADCETKEDATELVCLLENLFASHAIHQIKEVPSILIEEQPYPLEMNIDIPTGQEIFKLTCITLDMVIYGNEQESDENASVKIFDRAMKLKADNYHAYLEIVDIAEKNIGVLWASDNFRNWQKEDFPETPRTILLNSASAVIDEEGFVYGVNRDKTIDFSNGTHVSVISMEWLRGLSVGDKQTVSKYFKG